MPQSHALKAGASLGALASRIAEAPRREFERALNAVSRVCCTVKAPMQRVSNVGPTLLRLKIDDNRPDELIGVGVKLR